MIKRILSFSALILVTVILSGCLKIVYSYHPLYSEETVEVDQKMLGNWVMTEDSDDMLEITQKGDKAYMWRLFEEDKEDVETYLVHLVNFNGEYFLDIENDSSMPAKGFTIPVHYILKVLFTGDTVSLYTLDNEKFENLVKDEAHKIQFVKLDEDTVLFTAKTKDMQVFFNKFTEDKKDLFKESLTYTRKNLPQ